VALDSSGNLYCISVSQQNMPGSGGLAVSGSPSGTGTWLVSLDRAGASRFRLPLGSPAGGHYATGPLLGLADEVYVGFDDGTIRCYGAAGTAAPLDFHPGTGAALLGPLPDGGLLVQLYTGPAAGGTPAVGPLGKLDTAGAVIWQLELGDYVVAHFVDATGHSYLRTLGAPYSTGGRAQQLICISAAGELLFSRDILDDPAEQYYEALSGQPVPDGHGGLLLTTNDQLVRLSD
jgi:hypothetical protein